MNTSPATAPEMAPRRVPAVGNAVAILRLLAASALPVPGGAIARRLALPRSSTYQILQALVEEGMVVAVPERHGYALGVGAFELGCAYLRHEPLENIARPVLRRLVDKVGQTTHLGVLRGHETLYLLKEQPPHSPSLVTAVGVRLPAHLTATGRAMLAFLPGSQINAIFARPDSFVTRTGIGPRTVRELKSLLARERRHGWSMETGETTDGVTCISSAVFDHGGYPLASVSVSFIRARVSPESVGSLVEDVCSSADHVTACLAGRPPQRLGWDRDALLMGGAA